MSIRKGDLVIAGSGGSGSGSAMNVDDITTTLNSNDEIQAIGVIEKNENSVKYDWVGTEEEWIAGRSNGSIEDDYGVASVIITRQDKNIIWILCI